MTKDGAKNGIPSPLFFLDPFFSPQIRKLFPTAGVLVFQHILLKSGMHKYAIPKCTA